VLDNLLRVECKDDAYKGRRGRYNYESVLTDVPADPVLEAQENSVNRCCAGVCESDYNDSGRQSFVEAQVEDVNQDDVEENQLHKGIYSANGETQVTKHNVEPLIEELPLVNSG
jgi:hypothetical protein